MEHLRITRGIEATDERGRRVVYIEQEWASVSPCPACEAARRLEARREAEAAAPLSRWNLAGAGLVVALFGLYAWLMLR